MVRRILRVKAELGLLNDRSFNKNDYEDFKFLKNISN